MLAAGLHSTQHNGFALVASFRCIRAISADISTTSAAESSSEQTVDQRAAPDCDGAQLPHQGISPSFVIRAPASASNGAGSAGWTTAGLRLDRINSSEVLGLARQIYFRFLASGPAGLEPAGIVLDGTGAGGRVVVDPPVLLPDEQFVPIDWLRSRNAGRSRQANRAGPPRSLL